MSERRDGIGRDRPAREQRGAVPAIDTLVEIVPGAAFATSTDGMRLLACNAELDALIPGPSRGLDPATLLVWADPEIWPRLRTRHAAEGELRGVEIELSGGAGRAWVQTRDARLGDASFVLWQLFSERGLPLGEGGERFRLMASRAFDLISELDGEGRLVYASPSHLDTIGYAPDELVGRPVFELVHQDDRAGAERAFARMVQTGESKRILFRLSAKGGGWRWLEGSGSTFQTSSGEVRTMVVSRDVTDRNAADEERRRYAERLEAEVAERTDELERTNQALRKLQGRLIEAERLGAAGQLSGQIAHAINNPLMALIGTLQMRLEAAAEVDPVDERLLSLARRIENVVRSMLAFSRAEEVSLAHIHPETIFEQVAQELGASCASHGVELVKKLEPETPALEGDAELLSAGVAAIAENAIEASPKGSVVELWAGRVAGGRAVELSVGDAGPGIPEALRLRVFEPFFTTKRAGTGLGLAIASGIVRGHGGRILIEDRRPRGTLVRVHIPIPGAVEGG